jgi:hypothetical protein
MAFFENHQDFQGQVQLLNGQLQGQEFFTNMLADVQVAHRYLSIFLTKDVSFGQILQHLRQQCSADGKLEKIKAIETSLQNITEIKVKFAQVNEGSKGIIPQILYFNKNGW